MFEHLSRKRAVIVTGPHRSGTTICAEMVGHDTGLPVYREEAFEFRNVIKAQRLIRTGGVFQGPYLLPWAPILACEPGVTVIYLRRDPAEIEASLKRLRERGISTPFFNHAQASRLWRAIGGLIPDRAVVDYHALREHPLWRDDRQGWHHRQTA